MYMSPQKKEEYSWKADSRASMNAQENETKWKLDAERSKAKGQHTHTEAKCVVGLDS